MKAHSSGKRVLIVGAGIVGLAAAWNLAQRFPDLDLTILDKESGPALHQSGRNSGVVHSGIYYQPDSLKSRFCLRGNMLLREFCRREDIPLENCGKVIVAINADEIARLQRLHDNNSHLVRCAMICKEHLRELEPHCAGRAALHVPDAAVVDFGAVARRISEKLLRYDHAAIWNETVVGVKNSAAAQLVGFKSGRELACDLIVFCGGLQADRLAALSGLNPAVRIVPFRGEYFRLNTRAAQFVNGLIYPAPDPALPFLGVHLHRLAGGGAECGPNAVLSFGRESYGANELNIRDAMSTFSFGGSWRLFKRHWRSGLEELRRSHDKTRFVNSVRRLVPEIAAADLTPRTPGIRAQAVDKQGHLFNDFLILEQAGQIHVVNAPSPAATAAFAIGEEIAGRAAQHLSA